jgi:hypothetical protein
MQELLQGKLSDEEYERLVEQPAEDLQRVIDQTRARDEAVAPSPASREDLQDLADYDTGAVSVGTTACGARVIAVVAVPADIVLDEADQRAIRQHLADAVDGVDHVIDVSRERATDGPNRPPRPRQPSGGWVAACPGSSSTSWSSGTPARRAGRDR